MLFFRKQNKQKWLLFITLLLRFTILKCGQICAATRSEWDPSMLMLIFLLTLWTLIFKKQKLFPHKNVTVDIWFIFNVDWISAILLINLVTTALLGQASIQSPTSVQCISLPVSHETAGLSCSVGGELNPGRAGLCLLCNLTENLQFYFYQCEIILIAIPSNICSVVWFHIQTR